MITMVKIMLRSFGLELFFFSLIKFSAWSGVSGYTRKRPDYLTISYLGQNIFTENHRFPDQTCQNIFRKYSQEATVF